MRNIFSKRDRHAYQITGIFRAGRNFRPAEFFDGMQTYPLLGPVEANEINYRVGVKQLLIF